MHSVGGSGLGASDKHGGSNRNPNLGSGSGGSPTGSPNGLSSGGPHSSHNADVAREERIRAVRRHAERAARELDRERNDSVLSLAQALGSIDRDEMTAQFEARLGFLERQVERLVGRREEVDRAIHNELQTMRARVSEAISAVEAAGEADRQDREALEVRIRTALEDSERRSAEAARALRETLLTSWEQTVESERSQRERTHMEALERELAERTEVARSAIAQIRQSLESQVAVTVQAAHAVAAAALSGVAGRLDPDAPPDATSESEAAAPLTALTGSVIASVPAGPGSRVTRGPDWAAFRNPVPSPTYEPPAARTRDRPAVWEIETS